MWSEKALVAISHVGGVGTGSNWLDYDVIVTSISIDNGGKDIEQIPNLKGGRLVKQVPQGIITLSFEGYPINLDTTGAQDLAQHFHTTQANWDDSGALAVTSSLNRETYMICILFTNDTSATGADEATSASTDSYRYTLQNAYMTSYNLDFTDGELKATFEFKAPAFERDATTNVKEESAAQATLAAVTATF